MKGKKRDGKPVSWKSIHQAGFRPSASTLGTKRQWLRLNRMTVVLGVYFLIIAVSISIYLIYNRSENNKIFEQQDSVQEIKFETSGILTKKFATDFLGISTSSRFSEIDIFELKDKLESLSQVKQVVVERIFPGSLIIAVDEYQPVAKLGISKDQVKRIFFVSKDGEIFSLINSDADLPFMLPFVAGIKVVAQGDKYLPLEGIEPLVELLENARRNKTHLYNDWNIVYLGNKSFSGAEHYTALHVQSKHLGMITFSSKDISKQLEKLDYIAQDVEKRGLNSVKSIDLSLGEHVAVQMNNQFTQYSSYR